MKKKMYWFVQVERYESGKVLAAVLRSKLAIEKPNNVYKKQFGMEAFGQWCETEKEAHAIVAYAKIMNRDHGEQGVAA